MNKRQIELLNFVDFQVDGNNIKWKNNSLASIFFDKDSGLFSINVQAHNFKPGDYDSIEYLAIDLNHMLGLVYELNSIGGGNSNVCHKK